MQNQRRDIKISRRDVPESVKNRRRDVGYQRRDVPEVFKTNIATLESHVGTFQRGVKLTSRRCDVATLQRCDVESQRRDVTEKAKDAIKGAHV